MNKIEDIKIGNNINLFNGDCLEIMDKLIAEGVVVDVIICDPPYIDYPRILWYNAINTLKGGIC